MNQATRHMTPDAWLGVPLQLAIRDLAVVNGYAGRPCLSGPRAAARTPAATGLATGVLDRFLEDESLFGEFLRTPVSEGGVESLVVEPPHIVVEVGA